MLYLLLVRVTVEVGYESDAIYYLVKNDNYKSLLLFIIRFYSSYGY